MSKDLAMTNAEQMVEVHNLAKIGEPGAADALRELRTYVRVNFGENDVDRTVAFLIYNADEIGPLLEFYRKAVL